MAANILNPKSTKPLKGTLKIQVDTNQFRDIYPLTSADQVKNLDQRISSLVGKNLKIDNLGNTFIDKLVVNELVSENGKPITALITNTISACRSECDDNMLYLTDYTYSVEPVKYHDDQFVIKTGKDIANKELGKRFKINNVENAQKDNNNIAINSYINRVEQKEEDKLVFYTGEQVANNTSGLTVKINHVSESDKTINDSLDRNIVETYAEKDHVHSVNSIVNIDQYLQDHIVQAIKQLLIEGKIQLNVNSISMCQWHQYDFNANDTITIPLNKNTIYNRPGVEIIRLNDDQSNSIESFTYSFDINTYIYNKKYIDDKGKLINNKTVSFGSPRQLEDGYISYSGIITLDDITSITSINIK